MSAFQNALVTFQTPELVIQSILFAEDWTSPPKGTKATSASFLGAGLTEAGARTCFTSSTAG